MPYAVAAVEWATNDVIQAKAGFAIVDITAEAGREICRRGANRFSTRITNRSHLCLPPHYNLTVNEAAEEYKGMMWSSKVYGANCSRKIRSFLQMHSFSMQAEWLGTQSDPEAQMGQAKQRGQSYDMAKQRLLDRHDGPSKTVAATAINLFDRFILPRRFTGACYQVTMTLQKYFSEKHGITTEAVVGYVNDGTDDIMISHGWLEYEGMKIDLGLHLVEPLIS
ncbi:RlpA-like double-psi beta-barrel domain-containing protein [Sinorhizobium medicae]|uniref:hypothetical protein n=1 Tax=Sinorhizobium medicae TaxID=110321 RepID=UPI001F2786C1|nr:hypothetical protein [Sinorhizobium medicae]